MSTIICGDVIEHSILLAYSEASGTSGHIDLSAISRAAAAVAKLREAQDEILKLMDDGQPLQVVRFAVEALTKE